MCNFANGKPVKGMSGGDNECDSNGYVLGTYQVVIDKYERYWRENNDDNALEG